MTEMLSVKDLITKPTRNLSLGERMKCEFIMAMLHRPEVVFLDEPTIGLDVIAKEKIREFILEMNSQGTTFILTTHDMDDVERLARRVIVINFGEIVFDDSIGSLKKYLGTKKVIHLATHNPLPELTKPGIETVSRISDFDVELELDISRFKLNDFIEEINKKSSITDMFIGELPIESIIKELYLYKR
jgi:ABC-2 type transport system ATP-binding protein